MPHGPPHLYGYGGASNPARRPASASTGFNLNPQPQAGVGPFGAVPGPLGLPDPFADISRAGVNLAGINPAASRALEAGFRGQPTAEDEAWFQDEMARFGVSSGMPGSGLSLNRRLGNQLGYRQNLRNQAFQNYGPFVGAVAGTQTVGPALQNEIALQNALNAAAPDPSQAASYAKQLFDQYLQMLASQGQQGRQGGGPAGGTTTQAAPTRPPSGIDPYAPNIPPSSGQPGWGESWNTEGGYASSGNVPAPNRPLTDEEWWMQNTQPQAQPQDQWEDEY